MYICVYISILLITHFATENHRSDRLFPIIYLSDSALWVIAIMNKCTCYSQCQRDVEPLDFVC